MKIGAEFAYGPDLGLGFTLDEKGMCGVGRGSKNSAIVG